VVAAPGEVVVAVEDDAVVGSSNVYANRPGPGSHISSANVFVGAQFNAVAASNTPAVSLYRRLGFTTVGTVPRELKMSVIGSA
jgi:hypothetical protein